MLLQYPRQQQAVRSMLLQYHRQGQTEVYYITISQTRTDLALLYYNITDKNRLGSIILQYDIQGQTEVSYITVSQTD